MARKMAAGELQTTWFERHGSTPITEIPADWPDDYKRSWSGGSKLIATDRNIALIELAGVQTPLEHRPWE